jgi:hypothetical protein
MYGLKPSSSALLSGAVLLSSDQYDIKIRHLEGIGLSTASATMSLTAAEMIEAYKALWEPIQVTATSTMYRFKAATIPYTGRQYTPPEPVEPQDVMDEWWNQHNALADKFADNFIIATTGTFLIEGDEDEDFTYGAFLQAIANLNLRDDQWILAREFGNYYSVRNIDILLNS